MRSPPWGRAWFLNRTPGLPPRARLRPASGRGAPARAPRRRAPPRTWTAPSSATGAARTGARNRGGGSPFECALSPDVDVCDGEDDEEERELDEPEPAERVELHGERIQ